MNVAIFIRCALYEKGESMEAELLKRLAMRNGHDVIKIIQEDLGERPQAQNGIQEIQKMAVEAEIQAIMITQMSQLGFTPLEVIQNIDFFHGNRVSIYVHDLGIESLDEKGEVSQEFHTARMVLDGFVQTQKAIRSARIRNGQVRARLQGRHIGRPQGSNETRKQVLEKYPQVALHLRKGRSLRQTASHCGVSINTVRKVKKAISEPEPLQQLKIGF